MIKVLYYNDKSEQQSCLSSNIDQNQKSVPESTKISTLLVIGGVVMILFWGGGEIYNLLVKH